MMDLDSETGCKREFYPLPRSICRIRQTALFLLAMVVCSPIIAIACEDSDEDFICDEIDNCLIKQNTDQVDSNGDGVGDACAHHTAYIHWEAVDDVRTYAIWVGENSRIKNVNITSPFIAADNANIQGRDDDYVQINGVPIGLSYNSPLSTAYFGPNSVVRGGSVHTQNMGSDVTIMENTNVADSVTLGDRVQIHRNVVIGRGASVDVDSILRSGTYVQGFVTIGKRVRIGQTSTIDDNNVKIYAGAVIGDDVTIGRDVIINNQAYIKPGTYVPTGTEVPEQSVFPSN